MEQQQISLKVTERISTINVKFENLREEIRKVIVGQDTVILMSCIGLLTNGHILLEGVPGVAKTTLIKTIAQALGLSFSRIQFTPDLLPSDIIGTLIYNPKTLDFETKKRSYFCKLSVSRRNQSFLQQKYSQRFWRRCKNLKLPLVHSHIR